MKTCAPSSFIRRQGRIEASGCFRRNVQTGAPSVNLVGRQLKRAFHLLPSAYSHRLTPPISQRSPQPFYRAKLESPQPPHAQRNLDKTDDNCEEQAKRGSDLAEKGEAVAIEDRGADERLKQIVAQRHAPDRRKWRQPPPPGLTLSQPNDGRSINETHCWSGKDQ